MCLPIDLPPFYGGGYFIDASANVMCMINKHHCLMLKGAQRYPNPEPKCPNSSLILLSACNLLLDSSCLKDTEDGVKEVS